MRRGSSRQIMRHVSGLKPWEGRRALCFGQSRTVGEKVWAVHGTYLVRLHILQAFDDCAKRRMVGRGKCQSLAAEDNEEVLWHLRRNAKEGKGNTRRSVEKGLEETEKPSHPCCSYARSRCSRQECCPEDPSWARWYERTDEEPS